jgi:2-iminobutanoate/2-iminopropanoate deaminase
MIKETVITNNAPQPIGPYSQAIKINCSNLTLVYTSGQIAIEPQSGNLIEGGIKEQTKQVLENVKAVLGESGTNLSNVIKTTVFIKDMNDFSAMNDVYSEYFGESKPARSTIEAARLPKDALVEIEVIAYL